jgi:endonuclease/exonuclease/phosphatase family metal-dependent hydrolase
MRVKFLSLNLWNGELLDSVLDFLKEQDADILILQEVPYAVGENFPKQYRSFEILRTKLLYPYNDYAVGLIHDHPGPQLKIPTGNAILSKFKITESWHSFFHEPFNPDYHDTAENYGTYPHILQHAILETPAGEINVFNFHGVWDLDGDNYSDRRKEMADKIITAIKGKPNVLLGGDTNAKPTNQAIKDIGQHLTSVFGNDLESTFNMRRKDNPGYATAAVDMLFVSPDIKILERACPNVDISDHLPVVATLEVN